MKTTHLCRCSRGNDMTCPADQPLANLITRLTKAGYEKEIHVVDAMWAKSPLVECSNCGSRGGFDALGFRKKNSVRAFWLCRRCAHWTEV